MSAQDVTRHTFASHFLAAFWDHAAKQAMGHTAGSDTLFLQHRRAVTEADGRRLLGLTVRRAAGRVDGMSLAVATPEMATLLWPEKAREYVFSNMSSVPPEIRKAMQWHRMAEITSEKDPDSRLFYANASLNDLRNVMAGLEDRRKMELARLGINGSYLGDSATAVIETCGRIMSYYMTHINTKKDHRSETEIRKDSIAVDFHELFDLLVLVGYDPNVPIAGKSLFWLGKANTEAKRLFAAAGIMPPPEWDSIDANERYRSLERSLQEINCKMHKSETVSVPLKSSIDERRADLFSSSWPLLAAAVWCVVLGLVEFDAIWIYQLSRWGICAAAVHAAIKQQGNWRWPLWVLAVIYNPIAEVHFGEKAWRAVNWVSAAVYIGAFIKSASSGWIKRVAKVARENTLGVVTILFILGLGGVVGYWAWWESTPERREHLRLEQAESDAIKAKRDADANARWKESILKAKEERRNERKYPRALPGGGLDWSGVKGN